MANETNGAVHLTSLDLDITKLQAQISTVNTEIADMANKAVQSADKMREAFHNFGGTTSGGGSGTGEGMASGFRNAENAALSLEKQLLKLQNSLYKSPVKDSSISLLVEQANNAATKVEELTSKLREQGKFTKEDAQNYSTLKTELKGYETQLQRIVTQYNEVTKGANSTYESLNKSTTAAGNFVKTLSNIRDSVKSQSGFSELQQKANQIYSEFQKLRDSSKSGIVSPEASKNASELSAQLEGLRQKLIDLQIASSGTKTGGGIKLVNQQQVQDLAKSYATLMSQLSKFKNTNQELESMRASTKNAQQALESILNTFKSGGTATEEMTRQVAALKLQLSELQTQSKGISIPIIDVSQLQSLTQRFANFSATISGSDIRDSGIQTIAQQAKYAEQALKSLTENAINNGNVTKNMENRYKELETLLGQLRIKYADLKAVQAQENVQYKEISNSISEVVAKLKELERSASSRTTKQQASQLRQEYEQLSRTLKNMSVSDARAQLEQLNSRFQDLSASANTTSSAITRFVEALTSRARFMVISTIITTITRSITGVKDAIVETENAAIELMRVLDNPPDMSHISDSLYEIAYQYGQSFENVQDVAVKFAQTGMDWEETLDAVRATMLGLNTAELEVSTATNGLIAVMSQFNIEASDLEEVIDKINITADNFPVTSEKIVAALQRTGASAAAAGMTLEQTIGVITALSEATGRSGENIGTALNSIINFTSKASAIETFEKFLNLSSGTLQGQNPLAIWTALGQAIKDDGEALGEMMAQSEEFAELFDADIADAIGLTGQLNEAIAHQEDVFNAAGTYRKTYFIALLNNIATATEAIQNMGGALGYSMEENETAMEAFSKKVQQLKAAAAELAVQFGESGFLDFMKTVVEATTAVLKFTESIGGLSTVLLGLTTVIAVVKAQKITDLFLRLVDFKDNLIYVAQYGLKSLTMGIREAGGLFKYLTSATQASSAALSSFSLTAGGVFAAITLVLTGISALIGWFKKTEQEAENLRAENIALAKEASNSIESIINLYEAYEEAGKAYNGTAESADELKKASDALSDALGTEKQSVDELTQSFDEMSKAQKDAAKGEILEKVFEAQQGLEDARTNFRISMGNSIFDDFWESIIEGPYKQIEVYAKDAAGNIKTAFLNGMTLTPEEAQRAFREMEEIYSDLVEAGGDANYELARQVKEAMDELYTYIAEFEGAIDSYNNAANSARSFGVAVGDVGKKLQSTESNLIRTRNALKEVGDAASSAQGPIINMTGSFSTMEEYIEGLDKSIESLTGRIDGFQSAYETIVNVVNEYNEKGYMTADMIQTLLTLEPEYIQMLDIKSGSLQINQDKVNELTATTDQYMQELLIIQTVKQIDQMLTEAQAASDAGLTVEEYRLKVASQDLNSTTYLLVKQFYSGQISAEAFKNGIYNVAQEAGIATEYLNDFTSSATDAVNIMGSLAGQWITNRDSYTSQDFEAAGFMPGDPAFYEWVENNRNKQIKLNVPSGISRYYTPRSTSTGSPKSTGTEKTPEEIFEEMLEEKKDNLEKLLRQYEHDVFMIDKNALASDGSADRIVEIYKQAQQQIHNTAEEYRALGLTSEDEYVADLEEKWWEYEEKILQLKEDSLQDILDIYDHSAFLIEQNSDYIDSAVKKNLDDALDAFDEEMAQVSEKGIDLNKTIFGNIDTNNRQIIEWTSQNLQGFSKEIESWGYSLEELQGSISTIFGGSEWFGDEEDGIEIAFSPILQTEDGPVLLDSDTVREYIWGLIDKAGESWSSEDLFRLDTEGLEFDGMIIKNLLADIGETAIQTGEAMHYVGEFGSVNQAAAKLIEAQSAMASGDQLVSIYRSAQERIHALAEEYRAEHGDDESEFLRNLQELWWEYEEKIKGTYEDISDKIVEEHDRVIKTLDNQLDHAMSLDSSEWQLNLLVKKRDEATQAMEDAQKIAEQLREADAIGFADLIEEKSDEWWEYWNTVQEVNEKIADIMLEPYDDFISMADKMNLWDYMDMSKLDYLQEKLAEINRLYEQGILSAQTYNNLLTEMNVEIYEEQVNVLENRKDEIEEYYKNLIDLQEKEKDALEDEKQSIKDYYDGIVDGHKEEIEQWKKRKDETEDYYDELIDSLKEVQEENDRINQQIDYYNARQKIITNLEQAQARSGVEWREKEMEYQQQLIELDEDWNRTQSEWEIEDQITRLEELKELAVKDIDDTIDKINAAIDTIEDESEAALNNIEDKIKGFDKAIDALEQESKNAIQAIDDQIDNLSKTIADSIKAGMKDGFIDSSEEIIQANQDTNKALLEYSSKTASLVEGEFKGSAQRSLEFVNNNFFKPITNGVKDVGKFLVDTFTNNSTNAAKTSFENFRTNLINPLQKALNDVMSNEASSTTTAMREVNSKKRALEVPYNTIGKKTTSNIYVTNYVSNTEDAAKKTASILQSIKS